MSTGHRSSQVRPRRMSSRLTRREEAPHAPRRRGRKLLLAGLALVGLLWIAPWLVAKTPLANWLLARAVVVDGSLRAGDLSLGWFSPPAIYDLELRDRAGNRVAHVGSIRSDRSLVRLLWNRSDLGRFQVVRPQIELVVDGESSNLEAVLTPILTEWDDQPTTPREPGDLAVAVDVVDGRVTVFDRVRGTRLLCEPLSLVCQQPPASSGRGLMIVAEGRISDGTTSGLLALSAELAATPAVAPWGAAAMPAGSAVAGAASGTWPAQAGPPGGPLAAAPSSALTVAALPAGRLALKAENLPLNALQPLLDRLAEGTQLAGRLSADWRFESAVVGGQVARADIQGQAALDDLHLAAPWLGDDVLRLTSTRVPCQAVWEGERLNVEKLAVHCDVGQASFQGQLHVADGFWAAVTRQPYEVAGEVDLARLAALLPHTIHVRDDTQITAGKLQLRVASSTEREGLAWQGQIETSRIEAIRAGRPLSWEQPVRIDFAAHQSTTGPVVDRLHCESDFLEAQASGTPDHLIVAASFDLERLAEKLSQFVDLEPLELDGDGWAQFTWSRSEQERFEADLDAQVRHLRLAAPNLPIWRDESLAVRGLARGALEGNRLARLEHAVLNLTSATDRVEVRLARGVAFDPAPPHWPLEVAAYGDLAEWAPRLGPWLGPLETWRLAGRAGLAAKVDWSSEAIDARADLFVSGLEAHGSGLSIDEQEVEISTDARWQTSAERGSVRLLRATTSALSVDARDVEVVLAAEEPDLSGRLEYRGDLGRLAKWFEGDTAGPQPSDYQLAGQIEGTCSIRHAGANSHAELHTVARQVLATWSDGRTWQQPELKLAVTGRLDRQADRVQVDRVQIESTALRCTAAGELASFSSRRELAIDGHLDYDWSQLEPLLQSYVGTGVRVAGRQSQRFQFRGPLMAEVPGAVAASGPRSVDTASGRLVPIQRQPTSPPTEWSLALLTGDAGLGWNQADLYGFRLGAANLRARLSGGTVAVDPAQLDVNGGRVFLSPRVRLSPGPAELLVDRGPLVSQVPITPEMCQQGLMYLAPVLAGVTQAQGRFSIDMEGARVPLLDPAQGDVAGQLTVHSVEVGPGPLIQELAVLLNRPGGARLTRESQVRFRMVDGRVYHQGLELVFPELTIRTHGSVGLDQTLSILAEMPVPPKWIGNNALGQTLRNQTIRLPIGGTLSQPRIDQQALRQASAEFLRSTTTDALRNEVGRQLDRLLGPPR